MSSKRTEKWSSSASLTKFFTRLTRTLSFSSKKHPQLSKKSSKIPPQSTLVPKNFPKSVPVLRRHPPQPISKILYYDDLIPMNRYRQGVHVNIPDDNDDEEEDYSRYSLQPNLSLFNISTDNLHDLPEEHFLQANWLDDIFHSTKIEH